MIDNASDEVLAGYGKRISVEVAADGSVTVEDDGRGIPTGMHPEEHAPVLEIVFTRLHAGGKFAKADGSGPYTFAGGLHGVGVSVTNALSKHLVVTVWRDGQEATMGFRDGFVSEPLEIKKSSRPKSRTGTRVTVWPDPKYFDSPVIPEPALVRLLRSKAVLLPGCEVDYVNKITGTEAHWKYSGGLKEYLLSEIKGESLIEPFEASGFADEDSESFSPGEGASWVVVWTAEGPLTRESYVNLIPTPQGGTHEAGLKDGLFQAVRAFMDAHGLQPKGVKILAEDVFSRVNFVLSTKSLDPQFQGQTKEKLTSRDAVKLVGGFVRPQFEFWLNDHADEGKKLVEHIISQAQARQRQAAKYERRRASTLRTPMPSMSAAPMIKIRKLNMCGSLIPSYFAAGPQAPDSSGLIVSYFTENFAPSSSFRCQNFIRNFCQKNSKKALDISRFHGIITIVPSDTAHERKQNMRIWRNWQTR